MSHKKKSGDLNTCCCVLGARVPLINQRESESGIGATTPNHEITTNYRFGPSECSQGLSFAPFFTIIMADDGGGDGTNIFVFVGGDQVVPRDVTHVIIDKSVKIIPARAFKRRSQLRYVEMHDGVEIIEGDAFFGCPSLRGIKLPGVRVIKLNLVTSWKQLKSLPRPLHLPKADKNTKSQGH